MSPLSKVHGRTVLILFVLATAIYLLMLGWSMPKVRAYAPDIALFDMSPAGYSHEHAILLLDKLGEAGRKTYLYPQIALDFIYPALFAGCYAAMIAWVLSKRVKARSRVLLLACLPILAGLFDYAENLLIIRMILKYPSVSPKLVRIASTMTVMKSVLTTASFGIVAAGFILLIVLRKSHGASGHDSDTEQEQL